MNTDACLIIPAYNEEGSIKDVIDGVHKHFAHIVCVNDGSRDETGAEIAQTKAQLVSHAINLGQGAALQSGIEFALLNPSIKYFVTFDADGQHGVNDVLTMLDYIRKHPEVDIVLGSRFLGRADNTSSFKKLFLRLAVQFTNITSGIKLTDTHNGLRVFNRKVAKGLNITLPDMAHASEIIQRIADKKFVYKELPVTITYTDYSKAGGQSMMNAVNIAFDLMLQRIGKK